MYVEMLEDIAGTAWKARGIFDVPDNLASALISSKQARASTEAQAAIASLQASNDDFQRKLMEAITKPTIVQPKLPPAVDTDRIDALGPVAEQRKGGSFTEALRCVAMVQCLDAPHEIREEARATLRNYTNEFTEYRRNESTGKLDTIHTRQLDGGGMETVTRTGTDSLSGGPTYGFTLKPNYIGSLFRIARESEVFANRTRPVPVTQGNETIWPLLDQFKAPTVLNGIPQAAVFGGITMSYLGETTARVSSDALTDENRYKVVDLTGMTDFSRDYIVDNYIAMDSEVTRLFGEAVGWIKDWTYIRGDGVAKPQGYFNANATITGGPSTNSREDAGQIEFEDLVWMMSHLAPMCWMDAIWLTNITTLTWLVAIKNHAGNYVYQPNALISQAQRPSLIGGSSLSEAEMVAAPMGTMLGWPVYITEKVPILGTTGDLSLVCPYQYGDATKAGLEVGVSEHFYFSTDRIAYRFKMRHYGKSLWRAPYIQADNLTTPGSGTQVSPFVILKGT
jgi:HK97 family phage major capsid protein